MEFRISTAPGMPARKTQTLKYLSNMLFPPLFPCTNCGGILIGYLLNSPDLHPISTSRKELVGLHDMVFERGPRQGHNNTINRGFKNALVFTNPKTFCSKWTPSFRDFFLNNKFVMSILLQISPRN
jgi:hypothetical protein